MMIKTTAPLFFNIKNAHQHNVDIDEINAMRLKATKLQAKINEATLEIWELDIQISDETDTDCIQKLKESKSELIAELKLNDMRDEYQLLVDEIYELETRKFGKSDIKSSSPVALVSTCL